jgi:serine/threonine-protein kinase
LEELKELRAWLFCAELLEKAGEHLRAKALWEQALAEDIDASQALERISRGATGAGVSASAGRDQVTLLEHEVSNHTLRIVGEAGRGGAATVYQAVDGGLGRTVALKVYHESERFRAHLLHEARTAVALAGPGVVRVFDADPKKGWVAMEWAAGGSLRQHLQMPTGHVTLETLVWLYELVATLATIHRSGFVHADLKPANILFRHDNSVILSDFGLAVRAGERHRGQSAGYISPKRARGALARPEDDVYALGCVLVQVAECPASEGSCRVEAQALADSLLASDRPKDAGEVLVALSPPGKFH